MISVTVQKQTSIQPGELWPDDNGKHIQAHGGGVIKIRKTYYWYGEERSQGMDTNYRYVSCYSSKDLMNWTFKGEVVKMADPENLGRRWVLERPKVFYNTWMESSWNQDLQNGLCKDCMPIFILAIPITIMRSSETNRELLSSWS